MAYKVSGREVGDVGFGLMGLTTRNPPVSTEKAFATMKAALDAGCNYWNAGEFYGPPDNNSMTLLRAYFEKYPEDADKVVINVKGCSGGPPAFEVLADAEGVRKSVDNCLRMLGPVGKIHQFEAARLSREVPIEETARFIAEQAKAGKIGGVALSEVSADSIRRTAKTVKVTAVETELSLWQTDPLTNGIADVCKELDIPILAYSPLGRGALTGQIKSIDDIPEGDFRRAIPRYQPEHWETNMKLIREVEKLAKKKACTPAQIAINWILVISKRPGMPKIIPIPGASSVERVKENSTIIDLTEEDMKEIEQILASFPVSGDRYHSHGMALLDTDK